LPEVLARNDMDFFMSAPARGKQRGKTKKRSWRSAFLRLLGRRPARTVLGAAFSAVLVGIFINALFFQTARHPAPLFGLEQRAQPRQSAAAIPPLPVAKPAEVASAPMPSDPAHQAAPSARSAGTHDIQDLLDAKPATRDPIAALLRGNGPNADAEKARVISAQRALIKLGYDVRADGMLGPGTRQAIQKFERDRALAVTGELSHRTVRELSARSHISIP
jgi:hypothetical protein